ncbi:MAG: hypothetical protein K8F31_05900 [Roseovarius sp.]|nr:hypothetical protein [Roseovarius sp.]
MIWIFKRFIWVIGVALLFIGLVYLPLTWQSRRQALEVFGQVFTPSNRELILFGVSVICAGRLLYLDYRRARGDKDGPPILETLVAAWAFFARKERRLAVICKIEGDEELSRLRKEAEEEQSRLQKQAEECKTRYEEEMSRLRKEAADRQQEIDDENRSLWKYIDRYLELLEAEHRLADFDKTYPDEQLPMPPKSTDNDGSNMRWDHLVQDCHAILSRVRCLNPSWFFPTAAFERIHDAASEVSPVGIRPEEDGVQWPDDRIRMNWLCARAQIIQYLDERESAKGRLKHLSEESARADAIGHIRAKLPGNFE